MTTDTKAMRDTASTMKRQAQDTVESGREAVEQQARTAWAAGSDWAQEAVDAGKRAATAIDESFKERPIAMHLLAVGVGFALAALIFRRR